MTGHEAAVREAAINEAGLVRHSIDTVELRPSRLFAIIAAILGAAGLALMVSSSVPRGVTLAAIAAVVAAYHVGARQRVSIGAEWILFDQYLFGYHVAHRALILHDARWYIGREFGRLARSTRLFVQSGLDENSIGVIEWSSQGVTEVGELLTDHGVPEADGPWWDELSDGGV